MWAQRLILFKHFSSSVSWTEGGTVNKFIKRSSFEYEKVTWVRDVNV